VDDFTYGDNRCILPIGREPHITAPRLREPLLRPNAYRPREQADDGGDKKMAWTGHFRNGTAEEEEENDVRA
jgi:hypothetical protein